MGGLQRLAILNAHTDLPLIFYLLRIRHGNVCSSVNEAAVSILEAFVINHIFTTKINAGSCLLVFGNFWHLYEK